MQLLDNLHKTQVDIGYEESLMWHRVKNMSFFFCKLDTGLYPCVSHTRDVFLIRLEGCEIVLAGSSATKESISTGWGGSRPVWRLSNNQAEHRLKSQLI